MNDMQMQRLCAEHESSKYDNRVSNSVNIYLNPLRKICMLQNYSDANKNETVTL